MKKILFILLLPALLFASCKEETNEVEEYANWQSVNETAFKAKYASAVASLSDNIDTIRCYSLTAKPSAQTEDYIVVKKLDRVEELVKTDSPKGSPLFTDSVLVSYRGNLQPSYSYPGGLVFDQSFTSPQYNANIAKPVKLLTSTVVGGFSTALQNMTVGDYWIVYMPYQLGYGTTETSTIPAYSMLTFEIVLEKYW